MTRLFTDGAETGDNTLWTSHSGVTIVTDPVRSGVYCYWLNDSDIYAYKDISPVTECYLRFGIWFEFPHKNEWVDSLFPQFLSSGNQVLTLYFNTSNVVAVKTPETELAACEYGLNASTWYLFEIYFKMADTNGRFVLKIDGATVIDFTGDTKYSSYTSFNRVLWSGGKDYVQRICICLDDIAMNTTAGAVDSSWCGDGHIELLRPNAEGDTLQWQCSTGTTHYQLVDEIPSNGDTDYVYTLTLDSRDMYNLDAYTGTNKVVDRIWVEGFTRDTTGGNGQIKLGFKTGNTVYMQDVATVVATQYTRTYGDYAFTNPATGNEWTDSDLDGIQVVIEMAA